MEKAKHHPIFVSEKFILIQENMESFAIPDMIMLLSTKIMQNCRKLQFFSLEWLSDSLYIGIFLKGKAWIKKSKTLVYPN